VESPPQALFDTLERPIEEAWGADTRPAGGNPTGYGWTAPHAVATSLAQCSPRGGAGHEPADPPRPSPDVGWGLRDTLWARGRATLSRLRAGAWAIALPWKPKAMSVTCVLDQRVLRQALPNLLGPTEW